MIAQFLTIPLETLINQIGTSSRLTRDTAQVYDTGLERRRTFLLFKRYPR